MEKATNIVYNKKADLSAELSKKLAEIIRIEILEYDMLTSREFAKSVLKCECEVIRHKISILEEVLTDLERLR